LLKIYRQIKLYENHPIYERDELTIKIILFIIFMKSIYTNKSLINNKFEGGKKMKTGKLKCILDITYPSIVFIFPDLFLNKKFNIRTGMEFFHSNILIIVIDLIDFNRDIFLPKSNKFTAKKYFLLCIGKEITMRHFLEVEQFKPEEFIELAKRGIEIKNGASLNKNGLSIVNMFFESSTRTKMSFEVAEKQMDFHTYNFDVTTSAVNKGESLYDSILTMKALGMNIAVIRHQNNHYYKDLLDIGISIVNAGSGSGEHPSQCLLDMMTIIEEF